MNAFNPANLVKNQLRIDVAVEWPTREQAQAAALHLMTCHAHHFAVVREGKLIGMTDTARDCLVAAGLLR